jgi:hypothetical protein
MAFCFVTAFAVYAYYLLLHAQCALIICYRMRSVCLKLVPSCTVLNTLTKHKISGVIFIFFIVHGAYANNLLPHGQGTLTIHKHMRSVRIQFATECLQYASKANHILILPFQLNKVKT